MVLRLRNTSKKGKSGRRGQYLHVMSWVWRRRFCPCYDKMWSGRR